MRRSSCRRRRGDLTGCRQRSPGQNAGLPAQQSPAAPRADGAVRGRCSSPDVARALRPWCLQPHSAAPPPRPNRCDGQTRATEQGLTNVKAAQEIHVQYFRRESEPCMTDNQLSRTAEAVPPTSDEDELRAFGYEPQLERSMGAWSSFSISISCMCVTAGVFTTYAYSLGMVGPAFVWTWLIVSIGQILVALVLAELAGRMPISGYAYQWTSRLINSHYGWFVGWAGLMAFIPGFTGLNFGLAPILSNRLGIEITPTSTLIVVLIVLASQLAINLAGVRIASRINNAVAFTVEIGLSIILTAILLIVGFITNPVQSFSFLTTSSVAEGNGFTTAFLLSGLLAMWVLTGFEGAADLAEETKLATRHVPKAVIRSLIFAIVVGFFMIVGLTINIDNLADTVGADVPVAHILETALGSVGAAIFESVAIIALYAGGLANMAAASRLMFSLSRDNMLPASSTLKKVSL